MTRAPLAAAAFLLVLLPLLPPAAGHTDEVGHGHLFLSLGDDTGTTIAEPEDQLTYRFEGTLPVERGDNGTTYIRFALPQPATLQTFIAPGLANKTESRIVEVNGTPYARLAWTEDPPAPGTAIHDVHLVAVRTVDPRASFLVRWPDLDRFEDLPVRVEVSPDHTLTSGGDLIRQAHTAGPRKVWSQHDFDGNVLEVSIRPTHSGADPAFSAPPSPALGWLILAAIALVSGGAWAVGKKIENRRDE